MYLEIKNVKKSYGQGGSYVQVYSPKLGCNGWVNAGFLA